MLNSRNIWRVVLPSVAVIIFLGSWSLYVRMADVSAFVLPSPEAIAIALVNLVQDPSLWYHVRITVTEAASGFMIAVALGLTFGFVMARVPPVEWAAKPFIVLLQLVPKIALAPLFILWFGFGLESKIVIAAALAFFPIFSNALIAFKSVDKGDSDVMVMLQASPLQRLMMLELPTALPVVLTGMEVSVVMAMIGAIVGEFIGGSEGLGYLAVKYLQELSVPNLFAVIVVLTMVGLTLYLMIGRLRAWFAPWHGATGAQPH